MPHTPRTSDGAAPGGARPAAPRQPPPPVATGVSNDTIGRDGAHVLVPAHASPRRAARAVALICSFVKVSRQPACVSDIHTDTRQEAPVDAGTRNGQCCVTARGSDPAAARVA